MAPQVSIILPTFNGENYIREAIESCLSQSFDDFELIVVNDCSTDSTLSIVESIAKKDSRIKILNNTANLKLPASLNVGFKYASGKYFTWTSDDNIFTKNAMEVLMAAISNGNSPDIVYSSYKIINEQGDFETNFGGFPEELIFQNIVGACFLFKKEVYMKLSGFDEKKYMIEDYDFWIRALKYFDFTFLDQTLYTYRRHAQSISSNIYKKPSVYNDFVKLHHQVFFELYSGILQVNLTNEEISTLTALYFNKHMNDNADSTITHYNNCINLLGKLAEIDWKLIHFEPIRVKNVLDAKKKIITETYIHGLYYWKSQFEENNSLFKQKYILPSFWLKKIRSYLLIATRH